MVLEGKYANTINFTSAVIIVDLDVQSPVSEILSVVGDDSTANGIVLLTVFALLIAGTDEVHGLHLVGQTVVWCDDEFCQCQYSYSRSQNSCM